MTGIVNFNRLLFHVNRHDINLWTNNQKQVGSVRSLENDILETLSRFLLNSIYKKCFISNKGITFFPYYKDLNRELRTTI